jgi:hypothetical protein
VKRRQHLPAEHAADLAFLRNVQKASLERLVATLPHASGWEVVALTRAIERLRLRVEQSGLQER